MGTFPRAHKEAVAVGVSMANACPYCESVHSMLLAAAEQHESSRAFVEWGRRSLSSDGAPPSGAHEAIGTAVAFHYINRMVSVFLDESPLPSPLRRLGGLSERLFTATVGRRLLARVIEPGASLPLLPPAALPDDLAWARGSAGIADAFARASSAIDRAGRDALPPEVRELVARRIEQRHGEAAPLERSFIDDAVAPLRAADRPLAAFALCVAFAPYRVDANMVGSFREQRPSDADLVGAASWSAFTTARRIGTWLSR